MIHHLSIAARDPQHAAGVLAELMGGKSVPFPPNPGSFFALQLDDHGSGVEVYPAGTELAPNGSTGGTFVKQPSARGFGATHFALSVPTDADKVEAIAAKAGWQCYRCNRGPVPRHRGVGRERDDGRDPAARLRGRIPRLHPARQGIGRDGSGAGRRRPALALADRSQREANESNAAHHCARPGCRCRLRRQRYRRAGGGGPGAGRLAAAAFPNARAGNTAARHAAAAIPAAGTGIGAAQTAAAAGAAAPHAGAVAAPLRRPGPVLISRPAQSQARHSRT